MNKEKTPLPTGEETPNTSEEFQAPKKRGRKVYQEPVIVFVKPWLKPKIKEKKQRKGKAEVVPEPALEPQAVETPAQVVEPPKADPVLEQALETPKAEPVLEQVTETPVEVMSNVPEELVAEEPVTEDVEEPECENDADEEDAEVDLSQSEIAEEDDEEYDEDDKYNADDEVTATFDEAADTEDEAADIDDEEADTEDEVADTEDEVVDTEDEAVDTEDEVVDTEDEAVDTEDEVVDTEDEAADTEDEAADTEDEVADTEDEVVDTEDEAVDTEDEVVDTEDEVADTEDEVVDTEDEVEEETVALKPATEGGRPEYIVIKYNRSFLAKLIQSGEWVKQCYSELKNKLLSYRKVKSRISWKCESFRIGRKTIAKLRLRGKTLTLCFVGDPDEYVGTKYAVESLAEVKSYAATPCMYRIRSNRRLVYAKQLIERIAEQNGLVERATEQTDYVAQYPYETTEALIERKLIKVLTDDDAQSGTTFKPSEVRAEVAATEVDKIMSDEVAASLIEKSERASDKTKQGIINIDMLSQAFDGGEIVTLAEIKKRIKGFNKKTTYLKVLARGTLDKPLTVEADSFSLQAVKMIIITGGKVIKKQ